jgi:hypothetical protein
MAAISFIFLDLSISLLASSIRKILSTLAISLIDDLTLQNYKAAELKEDANKLLLHYYRNSSAYPDALELIKYTPKRFHNTSMYKQLLESYINLATTIQTPSENPTKPKRGRKPKVATSTETVATITEDTTSK